MSKPTAHSACLQAARKFFLVPTPVVAKMCGGDYHAQKRIKFTVDKTEAQKGSWSPAAAAQAAESELPRNRKWTLILAAGMTSLADCPAHFAELLDLPGMLCSMELATKPTCEARLGLWLALMTMSIASHAAWAACRRPLCIWP